MANKYEMAPVIQEYKPAEDVTVTKRELVFDDGRGTGFAFACDTNGQLLPDACDAAVENYKFCMSHPKNFKRWNKIVTMSCVYREPASGRCACGEHIELIDIYRGACDCPYCGRWYNLFGQEILPPEKWEDETD